MKLSDHSIGIIILAAGLGERMGLSGSGKLLLPLRDGLPIIAHAIRNALAFEPTELVVVVQPDAAEIIEAAQQGLVGGAPIPVKYLPNPQYREGMATSLAAGISALGEGIEAALVMLGDTPHVAPDIVERLVAAYVRERKPMTIPQYGSAVGPPTLFARQLFADLLQMTGEVGGRQLLAKYPDHACLVPFQEGERPPDIDTGADYAAMRDA